MLFTTKIAVIVRQDLAAWQKLNVVSFLAGGLVGQSPELAGEPYRDGSHQIYGPLIRQPVMIFAASGVDLTRTLERCLRRGLTPIIYTAALFSTGNDIDNRAAVAAVPTPALDLVGLAIHADKKDTDRVVKGLDLHQ